MRTHFDTWAFRCGRAWKFCENNVAGKPLACLAKPYDRLLKNLADEDPRGLLFPFGILPISAVDVEIASLAREVLAPSLEVDHLYRLRTGNVERLVHLELQSHYKLDLPDR